MKSALASLFAGILLSSCAGGASDRDKMLEVSFRPLAQIGGSADTTLLLRTLLPASVGVDSAGRIYVLDASEGRIRVYTPTGELITTRGRRGGGPGEILNTFSARLAVSPNGTVWLFDRGRGGLTGFHTNGTILPTIPLQVGGLLWGLAVDDSMRAVVLSNRGDSVVLRRTDGDVADTLETIILPSVRPLDASRCGLAGHSERPIFSPVFAWTTLNGMVAVADQDSFALRVISYDGRSRLLSRETPARNAIPELAARMLPDGWFIEISGQGRCTIPSAEVIAQIGHAATVPPYEAVVFDRGDRIWALRNRIPGESSLADIFSLRDGYEGTVALGDVWPVAFLPGGSLASIEHDESDAPLVRIYAMDWRGRGAP